MKDLMKYVEECQRDLDLLRIPYRIVRKWEINTRAKARWGLCKRVSKGVFDISISARLLEDDVADQAVKDTITHELLHTVSGAYDHQVKWKTLARLVNTKIPGYNIKRTTSYEEKGIAATPKQRNYRYVLQCEKCGYTTYRERESKLVQNPDHYRCALCGGRILRLQ